MEKLSAYESWGGVKGLCFQRRRWSPTPGVVEWTGYQAFPLYTTAGCNTFCFSLFALDSSLADPLKWRPKPVSWHRGACTLIGPTNAWLGIFHWSNNHTICVHTSGQRQAGARHFRTTHFRAVIGKPRNCKTVARQLCSKPSYQQHPLHPLRRWRQKLTNGSGDSSVTEAVDKNSACACAFQQLCQI